MLSQSQTIALFLLVAFLGGCALIGLCMLAVTVYSIIMGEMEHIWLPIMLFGVGGIGSAGTLWLLMKRYEQNAIKKLGLDD